MNVEFRFPEDVRGWLSEPEGRRLAALAQGKRVLELGSYAGRSTICMAQTADKVYAADWHRGDVGSGFGWTLDELVNNLRKYDLADKVALLVCQMRDLGGVFSRHSVDVVFVDGSHDYESVVTDLDIARQAVIPGGIIALHDANYPSIKKAATDVLGWDLTDQDYLTDSLYTRYYGLKEDEKPVVFIGIPTRNGLHPGVLLATHNTGARHRVSELKVRSSSLLTSCFNSLWCDALNHPKRPDIFCMLHDDISPEPGWLDALIEEMRKYKADVMAAVMPIKDVKGLSSTAVYNPVTNRMRRLTISECCEIGSRSTSFDAEAAGYPGWTILANTGCWVCDFSKPWVEEACFTIRDRNVKLRDGQWATQCFSEDWMFSKWCAERGLKVMATMAVKAIHDGHMAYPNSQPWGTWETDQATDTLFDPSDDAPAMPEPLFEVLKA